MNEIQLLGQLLLSTFGGFALGVGLTYKLIKKDVKNE